MILDETAPTPGPDVEGLVTEHLDLARALAARYRGRGQPDEDLTQVAFLGLCKAARGFRVGAGPCFEAYATPTITGELRRHFRDHGWDVRPPRRLQELRSRVRLAERDLDVTSTDPAEREQALAERVGTTLTELREVRVAAEAYSTVPLDRPLGGGNSLADTVVDGDDRIAFLDDLLSLAPAFARLTSRERRALTLRYWSDATQTTIAEDLGISQMQVSRVLSSALHRLREAMQGLAPVGPAPVQGPVRSFSAPRERSTGEAVPACERIPSRSSVRTSAAA